MRRSPKLRDQRSLSLSTILKGQNPPELQTHASEQDDLTQEEYQFKKADYDTVNEFQTTSNFQKTKHHRSFGNYLPSIWNNSRMNTQNLWTFNENKEEFNQKPKLFLTQNNLKKKIRTLMKAPETVKQIYEFKKLRKNKSEAILKRKVKYLKQSNPSTKLFFFNTKRIQKRFQKKQRHRLNRTQSFSKTKKKLFSILNNDKTAKRTIGKETYSKFMNSVSGIVKDLEIQTNLEGKRVEVLKQDLDFHRRFNTFSDIVSLNQPKNQNQKSFNEFLNRKETELVSFDYKQSKKNEFTMETVQKEVKTKESLKQLDFLVTKTYGKKNQFYIVPWKKLKKKRKKKKETNPLIWSLKKLVNKTNKYFKLHEKMREKIHNYDHLIKNETDPKKIAHFEHCKQRYDYIKVKLKVVRQQLLKRKG